MRCRFLRAFCLALIIAGATCAAALAMDPRQSGCEFKYSLYPPGGFSPKSSKAVPRPDPRGAAYARITNTPERIIEEAELYKAVYDQVLDPEQKKRVDAR